MPRKSKRQQKPEIEHTYLGIRVEHYDARIQASVNSDVYAPQYAWIYDDADPVYRFTAQLSISGISTYPEERAGDAYDVTIYGDDAPSQRLNLTLRDVQARDKNGSPQYRTYRGREIRFTTRPRGWGISTRSGASGAGRYGCGSRRAL